MKAEMVEEIALLFKALSEPTRLNLLLELQNGETTVGRLADRSGTSMANISKHLTLMKQAGIVSRRKSGNQVYYALRNFKILEFCELLCADVRERYGRKTSLEEHPPASPARARRTRKAPTVEAVGARPDVEISQPGLYGLSENE